MSGTSQRSNRKWCPLTSVGLAGTDFDRPAESLVTLRLIYVRKIFRKLHFPKRMTFFDTYNYHGSWEGKPMESCSLFSLFCRLLNEIFCRKAPIATGRVDQLKLGEVLNLIEYVGY